MIDIWLKIIIILCFITSLRCVLFIKKKHYLGLLLLITFSAISLCSQVAMSIGIDERLMTAQPLYLLISVANPITLLTYPLLQVLLKKYQF